jgi:hypothetical protein
MRGMRLQKSYSRSMSCSGPTRGLGFASCNHHATLEGASWESGLLTWVLPMTWRWDEERQCECW